jgi:hypothetical protein
MICASLKETLKNRIAKRVKHFEKFWKI